MAKKCDALPTLKQLLQGPVVLTCKDGCHRQLRAAGLYSSIELRLTLKTLSQEGDAEEWEAIRAKLATKGKVVCPECDGAGKDDYDQSCGMCNGNGMVDRATWDHWYYQEKSCKAYSSGCEERCRLRRCPHDAARAEQQIAVLVLEAKKGGSWKDMGDSLDGFKLVGLATDRLALERFIWLVATTCNVPMIEDEEA